MSSVTLKFECPEERADLDMAMHASDLKEVITNIIYHLRNESKYEGKEETNIEELRDLIWEIIKDHDLERFFK